VAEKIISPGVFTDEVDQTFLPTAIADIGGAVVGPTIKGPVLVPTTVKSYSEYQTIFGDSFKSGSNYYTYLTSLTAKEYLKNNDTLTIVRVLPGSPSQATTTISSSIDPAIVGGGTRASASITFVATAVGADTKGYLSSSRGPNLPDSMSFFNSAGTETKFIFTGSSAALDGIKDSATAIFVRIPVATVAAKAGESASKSVRDAINASASLHDLNISASSGPLIANHVNGTNILTMSFNTPGAFGKDSGRLFGASESGSGWSPFQNIQTASVSMSALAGAGNTVHGFQGGHDFGGVSPTFKTPFKLHTLSEGTLLNSGDGTNLKETTNNLLLSGSEDNLRFEISDVNNKRGLFSLQVRRGNDTINRKKVLESWNNLTLDPNVDNYISKVIGDQHLSLQDSGTSEPYLKLNGSYPNKSKYIRVEVLENTEDYLDKNGNVRTPAYSASLPSFHSGSNSGSYGGSFSGGTDGNIQHPQQFYENIVAANNQGLDPTTAANGKTSYEDAINLLSNQDNYDFNLLFLPGILDDVHSDVCSEAINMCEERGDCFVVVDPVVKGSSITDATTEASTRNSNYAAMYWPWVKIPDNSIGRSVWVPPSVAVAGVYSLNDKVSHEWFAPAGLNRGLISNASMVERKLTQGNRDELYDSNVNPIVTFPGQGVTVFGQKTLQKKSSALDRVNVRRLLIKLKKFVASTSRFLIFEQNNITTRKSFLSVVNPYMEQVQAQSGLNAFRIVMDDTNNTADVVDRNILYGQIFVQPTRTAEFVVLDFTVQPTGATFPE
tara:strand:+ start:4754 stop:7090 length:2337 start_codon:yes stop_codon:yes gene_type:complete